MEKLSPLTFIQNMPSDGLHFESKVDTLYQLQLTTEHSISKNAW